MPAKRKILIVDGHPVFRHGLAHILGLEKDLSVCGEAGDGPATLASLSVAPDLVTLDLALEGMSGLDLVRALREKSGSLRIVVISTLPESLHAERALRAGANGYVMKSEPAKTLVWVIRQVLAGKTYVSADLNERILQGLSTRAARGTPAEVLSNRELDVFRLIGQGYGTRQIAETLSMSMKTVETHRLHMKEKLKLATTVELVQRAIHWMHREND
jgi:DNA-binding NarL/FixJ family response regulator